MPWKANDRVGHSFDKYDRGTLSWVGSDDTGEDHDNDDLVLEVAIVERRGFFDWLPDLDSIDVREQLSRRRPPWLGDAKPPGKE